MNFKQAKKNSPTRRVLGIYYDRDGSPRAWAMGTDKKRIREMADQQLGQYLNPDRRPQTAGLTPADFNFEWEPVAT